ncbi:hypothetical protein [Desulfobacula phenolica]|uniref:Peptidase n=1 Tax=Desulfobacula phenolica TaxID=90732 RepID=A0A1H2H4W3_9BACT|nr:hypothetical protein [Desulfobacula phenolica]SDU26855.1 hypothetical protein SAMN04487931_10646 [Desulfobacula phenolica]
MKFKGFEEYIEIFKGGKQTDSSGTPHDGDKLIEKALASFNANDHEPPAVIGHPKENAPAFAWVEGLKEEVVNGTKVLMAKFKQVVPEFEEMVKKGLFKKRSASFYPDGRLRHVGFLGAAPPAVKGLADIGFNEDDQVTFEFEESWKINSIGRLLNNIREFIIEKFGIDEANKVLSQWAIEDIKEPITEPDESFSDGLKPGEKKDMATFSEEQVKKAVEDAKKEERDKVNSEFEEKRREKQLSNDLESVQAFCDTMVKEGKIAPAWIDSGLKQFMESLAGSEPIEFSENQKQTPLEWLKDFFENQVPKLVEFKEIATREDLPNVEAEFAECEDEDRLELHKKIKALAAKENISYAEAADRVS